MKLHHNLFINRTALVAASLALGVGTTAQAIDYTWGGGNLDWSDNSASGWNGGPPSGGDNATINSGIVTLTTNNLTNSLASVTIGGPGTLTQTTGNTWSAFNNLTLSGGTLESVRPSGGGAFGAYQLSNTVNVTGSTASTISTNGSGSIFINLGLAVNDSPTFTTFNVSDVTSSPAADLTVSTVLADNIATNFTSFSAAGLVKTGAGTMTLSANNIYTAGTTVNNGVLEVAGSSAGNSYIRGTATVSSGAELRYTGGDGTGFGFTGGNKIDTLNINGGLVDSQNNAHLYGATVNMTGGELRVNGGVSNPAGNQIHWDNTTVNTVSSASAATISGRINLRGDAGFSNAAFNVADGSAATDLLVSAAVTEEYGSVGITKNGMGTMELSGTNSYTGDTTVSAGKLLISGNISTSDTIVNSGATLGGSGTVGSLTVNSGAFLNPGNSPGILTVDGDYSQAGTLTIEIGGLTAGSQHDQVNVDRVSGDGSVTLSGGLVAAFNSGTYVNGNLIFLLLNDGTEAISGTFSGLGQDSTVTNFGGFDWKISYTANSGTSSFTGGNDIALMAVPEPGAAFLGGVGLLVRLRRRRVG